MVYHSFIFFKIFLLIFNCVFVYACVWWAHCVDAYGVSRSPGVRLRGNCETSDMGAGGHILVLWKSVCALNCGAISLVLIQCSLSFRHASEL